MTDSSPFAGPLPVIVAPVATEPFPALDFLPVDDAFALELRAESIEQLVGGDSLRRGESEHIEAGRSEDNADLVAGRDRVHVHGHLHEHTGRGLAEQAAHLETAVGATLEVHARHEDQVLFAGHMLDAWDGGAAIAAAMSDDTVGGGGVRTTVPLDLWVHALMGVEERIGTCTADAVLAELAATHYEREYASGVHRAALAVLQGALYQTTRSQFVPLMKLSTGVRNLIAGGGDGGGGNAPATSPPPVPPPGEGAAPGEAAAGTLAAGRTATETPVHGLRAAEGLADARRVSLEDVEGSIDLRAADELGETGEAMHADDLGELTRPAHTAEQLEALRETLRATEPATLDETTGGLRISGADDTASVHEASALDIVSDTRPGANTSELSAPLPRPGGPRPLPPGVKPGLLGGADRPPQPAAQPPDWNTLFSRLRNLESYYWSCRKLRASERAYDLARSLAKRVVNRLIKFGGNTGTLQKLPGEVYLAEPAYRALEDMASRAAHSGNYARATEIRASLRVIDSATSDAMIALGREFGLPFALPAPVIQPTAPPGPSAAAPTTTSSGVPGPIRPTPQPQAIEQESDWINAYSRLQYSHRHHTEFSNHDAADACYTAIGNIRDKMRRTLQKIEVSAEHLAPFRALEKRLIVRKYRALQAMARQTDDPDSAAAAHRAVDELNDYVTRKIRHVARSYVLFDAPPEPALHPPTPAGPALTVPTTIATPPIRLVAPGPSHRIVPEVTLPVPQPAGGLAQPPGIPGSAPLPGLPGPSGLGAASTEAGEFERWWLGLSVPGTTTAPGTPAAPPGTTAVTVTPRLHEPSPFPLQPVDPVPAPGTVRFDPAVHAPLPQHPTPPATTAPARVPPPPASLEPPSTVLPEVGLPDIARLLEPDTEAPHRAPPPSVTDPWRIRPPAMRHGPHPVRFDPWAPAPGPSARVMPAPSIRAPVMSTDRPPGWLSAETPGFARRASSNLPLSRRETVAHRFIDEDAVLRAEAAVHTGLVDAFGWPASRWRNALGELQLLHRIAAMDPAAAVQSDIDWRALEALMDILEFQAP